MAMIDYNGLKLQCQSLATLVNRVVLLESSDKTDELNLLSLKRLLLTLQKHFTREEVLRVRNHGRRHLVSEVSAYATMLVMVP